MQLTMHRFDFMILLIKSILKGAVAAMKPGCSDTTGRASKNRMEPAREIVDRVDQLDTFSHAVLRSVPS